MAKRQKFKRKTGKVSEIEFEITSLNPYSMPISRLEQLLTNIDRDILALQVTKTELEADIATAQALLPANPEAVKFALDLIQQGVIKKEITDQLKTDPWNFTTPLANAIHNSADDISKEK